MFNLFGIGSWISSRFNRRDVLIIIVLIFLFIGMRTINLEQWPIFSDEGIYIRWAKVAWKDASWRFISVTDGRQPLQTWGTIAFLKIFSPQDLLAGRMFSVTTGFVALVGVFSLLYYLWGKKAAYIGALLYICSPYFLFYDRMALVDSAVNAGFVWILFLSILMVRSRRLDLALILGFIGGFALLAKSSSRLFLGIAGLAPVLLLNNKPKEFLSKTINYWFLLGVSLAISLLFYNVQRLSPYFHYVALKNTTFVMTFSEFLQTPFAYVMHNIYLLPLYVAWESGWVIIVPALLGFILLLKKDRLLALYIALFFFIPYLGISFFAKILFGRYVLFLGTVVLVFAVYFFTTITNKRFFSSAFSLLIGSMLLLIYPILFDPAKTHFPPVDRGQYIDGATAVWGAQDLMQLMQTKAQTKPVLILAEGDFGLAADVLKVFNFEGDNVEVKGFWPLDERTLLENQFEMETRDVYVVFSHLDEVPMHWPVEFIESYEKPSGKDALLLYKLLPVSVAQTDDGQPS